MENNHTQFNNEKNIIEVETSKANQQIEKLIENLESLKKELLGVDIKNFGKDIEATVKNITDCGMQIEKMKKDLSVVFGEKSIFNQTYKSVSKFAEKIKDVYLKESKDPIGIEEALGAIFSKFQGIDAIVAGAALAFTSFFGMLQDGFSWLNEIVMLLGIAIVSVGAIILGIPAGIAAAVAGVIAAIATIAVVVKENWLEIRGFFSGLIADVVEIWGPVAMWFYENVIEPIVNFVSGLWMRVMQIIEGAWIFIQAMWMYIQTMCLNIFAFFYEHFIIPISNCFSDLWDDIVKMWKGAVTWFKIIFIEPLEKMFGISFSAIWEGIKEGAINAMNAIIGAIESAINWIIRGINTFLTGFNWIVEWAAGIIGADWDGVTLLNEVKLNRIEGYVAGGFPETGELFLARENGVNEMVGQIGRRSVVANNDQIVAGISAGVSSAMNHSEQNELLREQNGLLRALLEKDTDFQISGKSVLQSTQAAGRRSGFVLRTT